MTHDLVERLRKTGHTDYALMDEAADKLEAYMADADAHVSRLELVRRQEDEIRDIKAEIAALRAEKDELRKATIEEAATIAYVEAVKHCSARDGKMLIGHPVGQAIAAAIRNMGERTAHIACEHDWFDCSNAAVPPPAKSCRKCGWTVGDDETQGIYLVWPWLAGRAALEKETRE
jgi:hypothetical protein